MNLKWDDERTRKFVTNICVVTSDGSNGPNVMAVEWAHHVSHAPSLIAICITPKDATYDNILERKEFGINLCACDQNMVSSISGGYSGFLVDKIKVLKELGVEFYPAKKIAVPMLKGASMNAECKLHLTNKLGATNKLGDHTMFVGEVIDIISGDKPPLIYHDGKYWNLGKKIYKPDFKTLEKIKHLSKKHVKSCSYKS